MRLSLQRSDLSIHSYWIKGSHVPPSLPPDTLFSLFQEDNLVRLADGIKAVAGKIG
jgi:hypothetical protein